MKIFLKIFLLSLLLCFYGFTIKSGQVLSSDGKVYDFASPEEKKKIIQRQLEGGEQVGLRNNNLFIVYENEIINIPMNEISNLSDEKLELLSTELSRKWTKKY